MHLTSWPDSLEPLVVAYLSHDTDVTVVTTWGMTAWSAAEDIVAVPELAEIELELSDSTASLVASGTLWAQAPRPPDWQPGPRCILAVTGTMARPSADPLADFAAAREQGVAYLGDLRVRRVISQEAEADAPN